MFSDFQRTPQLHPVTFSWDDSGFAHDHRLFPVSGKGTDFFSRYDWLVTWRRVVGKLPNLASYSLAGFYESPGGFAQQVHLVGTSACLFCLWLVYDFWNTLIFKCLVDRKFFSRVLTHVLPITTLLHKAVCQRLPQLSGDMPASVHPPSTGEGWEHVKQEARRREKCWGQEWVGRGAVEWGDVLVNIIARLPG